MSFPLGISMRTDFKMVSSFSFMTMGGFGLFLEPRGLPLGLLEEFGVTLFNSGRDTGYSLPDESWDGGCVCENVVSEVVYLLFSPSMTEESLESVVNLQGVCFEDLLSEMGREGTRLFSTIVKDESQ